jgi:hypothetical protein
MEIILALCLGVTLSAAAGFRLFVPPLALSLVTLYGDLELSAGFDWVGTYPAAIALGVAVVIGLLIMTLVKLPKFVRFWRRKKF